MSLSLSASILKERADVLDTLNRFNDAKTLRQAARKLETKHAENLLEKLQTHLDKVISANSKIDSTIDEIRKSREGLKALNEIVQLAGNIIGFFA